jgi:hypothetical protein
MNHEGGCFVSGRHSTATPTEQAAGDKSLSWIMASHFSPDRSENRPENTKPASGIKAGLDK